VVQFYWDSYFIILSLLMSEQLELAKGMVENCLFLVERHGMVIANRKRWAAGSQLPFLSEMVRAVYGATRDKDWLSKCIPTMEKELRDYWQNADHLVHRGLSRYHAPSCYPANSIGDITIDHEATWDLSPRFDASDVLELLPVDLNGNLFRYESNFAYFYEEIQANDLADRWRRNAAKRARVMEELMWDEEDGLYYDYNFVLRQRKKIKSLASFFPLLYGFAAVERATSVAANLTCFEERFGLATCDKDYGYSDRQWNYPIGWAPLHLVVCQALRRYGFDEDADRVALKWLNLNFTVWRETGKFFEKYNVEAAGGNVLTDRYKNQEGFGWTNGVFHCLVNELLSRTEHN
jgi:alpha,alpha-trehalase